MDEDQQYYLSCQTCGEVFDSITVAFQHMVEACEDGFDIVTEDQAF